MGGACSDRGANSAINKLKIETGKYRFFTWTSDGANQGVVSALCHLRSKIVE
jgi:hypothetical protein